MDSRPDLPDSAPTSNICVLGGTNIAGALTRQTEIGGSFTIETQFGKSPEIFWGETQEVSFYHIPMHGGTGADRTKPDYQENAYLRTWSAFHRLGVTEVLGGATAGSINPEYKVGDWTVPDDFIDFNVDRPQSIAFQVLGEAGGHIWPRLNPATDPDIDGILADGCRRHAPEVDTYHGGVIAQGPGSRFESAAEVRMMQTLGCDSVTASIPTEMIYARQVGIHYGCIVGIVNPAEGLGEWDWDTLSDCYPTFHRHSVAIYLDAIPRVARLLGKERAVDALRVHPEFDPDED